MEAKEVVLALMELARDMGDPYAGDSEYDDEIELLTEEFEDAGETLRCLLERVVEMCG